MKTPDAKTSHSTPLKRPRRTPLDRQSLLEKAACPTTPPKTLASLSKTGDAQLTELIALNPNTPRKTLNRLWRLHPHCALENPIVLFWSLREGKPTHALLPVEVTMALYLELRKSGDSEALESYLPEGERRRWLTQPFQGAPETPSVNGRSPRRRVNPSPRIPFGIQIKHGSEFTGVYKTLATDPSAAVRGELAGNLDSIPFTSEERDEIQRVLAMDAAPDVRLRIAASKRISRELHLQLSGDPDFKVRSALASNPAILEKECIEGWNRLLAAGHAKQIALNPACPEILKIELIAHGSSSQKQCAWAGFRFHETSNWQAVNLSIEAVLADPNRLPELIEIAKNKTLGGSLKERLLKHPEARVTRALATQIHLTEPQRLSLLFHADSKTALRAAKYAPPADFLDIAADHPNPWVRALLAKKPGEKTWSLRAKLVRDPDPRVRIALCRGLPETLTYNSMGAAVIEIVKKTYPTDSSPRVRLVAKKSPHCSWKRSPKRWLP